MWRVAQVGWTVAEPTLAPTSSFGSRRSCAQATESRISSCGEPLGVLLGEHALAGLGDACVQEAASITIGSAPSPLQRQSRSTISFALWRCASPKPFELQGSPQQLPATSSGIQTGSPARAETSTSASTRLADGPMSPMATFGPSAERPKMRLVQEGT